MPSRLDPSEVRSVLLEDVVTITPIFSPKMFFRNIETVSAFRVRIIHTLNLGVSADPLNNGEYNSVVYDAVLAAGGFVCVSLDATIDNNLDNYTVELTNNGIVESIIQCWLEGNVDSSTTLLDPTDVVI